jgi:hypothetical protein
MIHYFYISILINIRVINLEQLFNHNFNKFLHIYINKKNLNNSS